MWRIFDRKANGVEFNSNHYDDSIPQKIVNQVIHIRNSYLFNRFIVVIPTSTKLIHTRQLHSPDYKLYQNLLKLGLPRPEALVSMIQLVNYLKDNPHLEEMILLHPHDLFLDGFKDFLSSVYAVINLFTLEARCFNVRLIRPVITEEDLQVLSNYPALQLLPHTVENGIDPDYKFFHEPEYIERSGSFSSVISFDEASSVENKCFLL